MQAVEIALEAAQKKVSYIIISLHLTREVKIKFISFSVYF